MPNRGKHRQTLEQNTIVTKYSLVSAMICPFLSLSLVFSLVEILSLENTQLVGLTPECQTL